MSTFGASTSAEKLQISGGVSLAGNLRVEYWAK